MAVSIMVSRETHHPQQGEVQVQFQTGHFCGLKLSSEGYQIDLTITQAITKFPTLSSRTDLQSFFGLTNQLSTSTDKMATLLEPLYPLLNTKNKFTWTANHDIALITAKQHQSTSPVLAFSMCPDPLACAQMPVGRV